MAMWQQKQTVVPWALQSADDELEDLNEGYTSRSTASSPAPLSIERSRDFGHIQSSVMTEIGLWIIGQSSHCASH